jgi:hypothetical protein
VRAENVESSFEASSEVHWGQATACRGWTKLLEAVLAERHAYS